MRGVGTFVLGTLALAAGCHRYPGWNSKSGEDGDRDGASQLTLGAVPSSTAESGALDGVINDAAGDSVDWAQIDLPKDTPGKLGVSLHWTAPRSGLALVFGVYNSGGKKVAFAREDRSGGRIGSTELAVEHAAGTMYIKIAAADRGDAGKYNLEVQFQPDAVTPPPPPPPPPPPDTHHKPPPPEDGDGDGDGGDHHHPQPPPPPPPPPPPATVCPDPMHPMRQIADCLQYFPVCNPQLVDRNNPKCDTVKPLPQADVIGSIDSAVPDGSNQTEVGFDLDPTTYPTTIEVKIGWKGDVLDDRGKPVKGASFSIRDFRGQKGHAKVKLSHVKFDNGGYTQIAIHPPILVIEVGATAPTPLP